MSRRVVAAGWLVVFAVAAGADQPGTPAMPPVERRVTLRLNDIETVPAREPVLPRYRFEAGTRLQYIVREERTGNGTTEYFLSNVSVYPLRRNPDGSWRLMMVERRSEQTSDPATGTVTATKASASLTWCEFGPDGRRTAGPSVRTGAVATLFPLLPGDSAEVRRGWHSADSTGFESYRYRLAGLERSSGQPVFRWTGDGPLNAVYEVALEGVAVFDTGAGRLMAAEMHSVTGWRRRTERKVAWELAGTAALPEAEFAKLTTEAETLYQALLVWDSLTSAAGTDGALQDSLYALAESALIRGRRAVTLTELCEALDADIEYFHRYRARRAERQQPSAPAGAVSLVGRPAPDWTLRALDGRQYRLKNLRGSVVVLDFWYRGCPWCIRAMPAMEALAQQFRGRPVQFFGMNVDRDTGDAFFVVDRLGLTYPVLPARGVVDSYSVSSYPTIVVVDRSGKVAEVLVGYRSDLLAVLAGRIRRLLEDN